MMAHLQLKGSFTIDNGAVSAIRTGKSLLPIGVRKVEGSFVHGELIACLDLRAKKSHVVLQTIPVKTPVE